MQGSSSVGLWKEVEHAYQQFVLWRLHIPGPREQALGPVLHLSSLFPAEVAFSLTRGRISGKLGDQSLSLVSPLEHLATRGARLDFQAYSLEPAQCS